MSERRDMEILGCGHAVAPGVRDCPHCRRAKRAFEEYSPTPHRHQDAANRCLAEGEDGVERCCYEEDRVG